MTKIIHLKKVLMFACFLSAGFSLGCSSSLSSYETQKRGAPQDNQDLGVLVSGVSESEVADFLEKNSTAGFRVLDKNDGFYEIFNADIEDIKNQLKGSVSQNEWVPLEPNFVALNTVSRLAEEEGLVSETDRNMKLNPCLRDPLAPQTRIKVALPAEGIRSSSPLELDTDIVLVGDAKPHALYAENLTTLFMVFAPDGNQDPDAVVFGDQIRFKTEYMGIYQVVFVAQDSRDVCAMSQAYITVTGNKKFLGNDLDVTKQLEGLRIEDFHHLPRIEAEQAWEIGQGEDVVIAVVDSGVNYNHPALIKNILTNENEIPGNGLDDDGNGFVDDYVGYDFSRSDGFPFDDDGHGSHVAGLAASSVFGVAKKAKILPVKALGAFGGDMGSVSAAIRYAVDRGAKIINLSVGNYGRPMPELSRALNYAEAKGVLAVAAAGNGHPYYGNGLNTDRSPNYPSALTNDSILAVAATTLSRDVLAPYSNYGLKSVDLAAPGGSDPGDMLKSCFLETPKANDYTEMSGTSMASPIVAGAAALVWSINPKLTAVQVKEILMLSGDKSEKLNGKLQSGASLNVRAAAELAKKSVSM